MDEEQIVPNLMKGPKEPTPEERAFHRLTHVPFADWCIERVQGRAPDDAHHTQEVASPVPVVQSDYFFAKSAKNVTMANAIMDSAAHMPRP